MKKALRLCISALSIVLGLYTPSWAQTARPITDQTAQRIDALFSTWDKAGSPGCALGVTQKGQLVYARGYGMSNLEYDVPITPDSIFSIGSISKQFTAFSIALLAREGKLSLDDDVRRYAPEVPDYGQRITIRHLLTHTSGLRDAWDLIDLAGGRSGDVTSQNDVLTMIARQKLPDFAPGEEFFYNNAGYILLAAIVERVSGQSQREFAETRIFGPLGMSDTHLPANHREVIRRRTSAYRLGPRGMLEAGVPVVEIVGADGILTTVGDLLKWEENFVDARIGGRALVDAMQTAGRLSNGASTNYGFGLDVISYRGLRTFGHGGTSGAYIANVVQFPDQHLAIAALCNLRTIDPRALTRRVADIVLGLDTVATVAPVPLAPAVSVGQAEIAALAGTYWNPIRPVLRFVAREGRLMMEGSAFGSSVPLVPRGGGRFRISDQPNEILFPQPTSGAPQELHIGLTLPKPIVLLRVTVPSYTETDLNAYAGNYHSDELGDTFTVKAMPEGRLVVLRRRSEPLELVPLKLDMFLSDFSDGAGALTFARAASGTVTGFIITGRTPRRLAFTRIDAGR